MSLLQEIGTLRSEDATAAKTSLKKVMNFLRKMSKFRKRNDISSSVVYVPHKT